VYQHAHLIIQVSRLSIKNRDINNAEGIGCCKALKGLDVSDNKLTTLEGIGECSELRHVNVSKNVLTDLSGLDTLSHLEVLNVSHNRIPRMFGLEGLTSLKALILGNNEIVNIRNLNKCTELNTLVMSNNKVEELKGISQLTKLKKLSISHNQIRSIPDTLAKHYELTELRLNANKITALPDSLEYNKNLAVLDIGNNLIRDLEDIQVLGKLRQLKNLNLLGNPLHQTADAEDTAEYRDQIQALVPSLEILDGKRLETKAYKYHNSELKEALKKKRKQKLDKVSKARASDDTESAPSDGQRMVSMKETKAKAAAPRSKKGKEKSRDAAGIAEQKDPDDEKAPTDDKIPVDKMPAGPATKKRKRGKKRADDDHPAAVMIHKTVAEEGTVDQLEPQVEPQVELQGPKKKKRKQKKSGKKQGARETTTDPQHPGIEEPGALLGGPASEARGRAEPKSTKRKAVTADQAQDGASRVDTGVLKVTIAKTHKDLPHDDNVEDTFDLDKTTTIGLGGASAW